MALGGGHPHDKSIGTPVKTPGVSSGSQRKGHARMLTDPPTPHSKQFSELDNLSVSPDIKLQWRP